MTVAAAFLLPGSPLPYVRPDNPPWGALASAMRAAGDSLTAANVDTIAVYSTQWIAVLDQLWQTRPHVQGLHVDENWHEYGDLPFDITIDTELTDAAIAKTADFGIRSKGVNYDAFPVDTGTIVAANFLDAQHEKSFVVTSNNVYHDWEITQNLGRTIVDQAAAMDRRIAVIGVGGLSGSIFRNTIDDADDHIASEEDDTWNRKILGLMESGNVDELIKICPDYAGAARVDMGFKHMAFVLGALGGTFAGADVLGYGPLYGSGGAVVEFKLA